jgi:hypothetical protein
MASFMSLQDFALKLCASCEWLFLLVIMALKRHYCLCRSISSSSSFMYKLSCKSGDELTTLNWWIDANAFFMAGHYY